MKWKVNVCEIWDNEANAISAIKPRLGSKIKTENILKGKVIKAFNYLKFYFVLKI